MAHKLVLIAALLALVGAGTWAVWGGHNTRADSTASPSQRNRDPEVAPPGTDVVRIEEATPAPLPKRVTASERTIRVRGRVLRADGRPLNPWDVRALFASTEDVLPEKGSARPDVAEGVFELELRQDSDVEWFIIGEVQSFSGVCVRRAVKRIRIEPGTEVLDVGLLLVDVPPVLAAGRVVDHDGNPVPDEFVRVLPVELLEEPDAWTRCATVMSDDDGRFGFRVWAAPDVVALAIYRYGRVRELARVPKGTDDVVLVLPGGTVQGTVLLDPSAPSDFVDGHIAGEEDGANYGSSVTIDFLDERGNYTWRNVPAGPVTVEIRVRGAFAPVASFEAVVVDGEVVSLPPVDLRNQFQSFDVKVVDQHGEPVPGAHVKAFPPCLDKSYTDAEGHLRLDYFRFGRFGRRTIDVSVTARGYLGARVENVESSCEVTLVRPEALRVRVVVSGRPNLPRERYRLGLHLKRTGGELGSFGTRGPGGAYVFDVPGAGSWDLKWSVREVRAGLVTHMIPTDSPPIEVADVSQEQEFHVAAPTTEIWRKVRELEEP